LLSILYPYRNRELLRLKRSFDSLTQQTNDHFKVYFIDYGSSPELANEVKNLCLNYAFITYQFLPTQFQPWNKSRALNSVIKRLKSDYCFVADVDLIFHPRFVETALSFMKASITTYFQVGYLNPSESQKNQRFHEYKVNRLSTHEATGLSLLPVNQLQELRGFDEFYHFWGAEDTDIHIRLKNTGYNVEYYDAELLLLHQWHPSYQSRQKTILTSEFQVTGILLLNQEHLKNAMKNGNTKVNKDWWGEVLSKSELDELERADLKLKVTNKKQQVNDVLFGILPNFKSGILKIRFITDPYGNSFKYYSKRILGKKVPEYYSLKEVNDMILLHLISFYRNMPYSVWVKNNSEIEIAIKYS
jgi:glycosyltransferase involved in cell wall biosynthesis